ncbi:MAG: tRNA dimethylallyltransferase, partial [Dokdonia sp.]
MLSFATTVVIPYTMTKYLFAVVGPTAIGKTALSIKIAQHFQTEIISADSRQFYKEMTIGTAVPDPDELDAATHHCIQHISIEDTYSVGHFEREAISLLETLHQKNPYVTMVGGSGMYVDAVIRGLDYFPDVTPGIREQLNELYTTKGVEALQELLKEKDPVYYERVDIQNHQRVTRALEVCLSSGEPFSSFLDKPRPTRPFETIKIGLSADRAVIYDRINRRVDLMIENGLVEEVK